MGQHGSVNSAPPRLQGVSDYHNKATSLQQRTHVPNSIIEELTVYNIIVILQVMATHSNHGWRFVNRYTNRSNGGIPIFSQERSRERAEKVCREKHYNYNDPHIRLRTVVREEIQWNPSKSDLQNVPIIWN